MTGSDAETITELFAAYGTGLRERARRILGSEADGAGPQGAASGEA